MSIVQVIIIVYQYFDIYGPFEDLALLVMVQHWMIIIIIIVQDSKSLYLLFYIQYKGNLDHQGIQGNHWSNDPVGVHSVL